MWRRFGDVSNYVECFAGSLAVLLGRPAAPPGVRRVETVNDRDAYLCNFWRALRADPAGVAAHADWPVNEADLHARHRWLVDQGALRDRVLADPEAYDVRAAGWWVWGLSAWIGRGWCVVPPDGAAPSQQLPHLGDAGMGVHRPSQRLWQQLPDLGNPYGRGVHLARTRGGLEADLAALAARLRGVRVACGDWARVLGPSVTTRHGVTGVFLDPPYAGEEHAITYAGDDGGAGDLAAAVRAWAVAHGEDPALRVALCGYEGEHAMPAGWTAYRWKAAGGYGSAGDGRGRANAARETVWFSPACLKPEDGERTLFDAPV